MDSRKHPSPPGSANALRASGPLLCVLLGLFGCDEGSPCPDSTYTRTVRIIELDLDLLFVIDDSSSMAEEQASLAEALPKLIEGLTSDTNPWTGGPARPVPSLHVGVISADLGTGPAGPCSELGDDGVLATAGATTGACAETYPAWLAFADDGSGSPLATDLACVLGGVGTDGCRFQQQLEATLKALTPGDGRNAGFLRPDSELAIVLLTDSDDCSPVDPSFYDPMDPRYGPDLALRCFENAEALHPVARYVEGLLGLRAENPDLLFFASIVGVPVDLEPSRERLLAAEVEAMLADPRMLERLDATGTGLAPSCAIPGRGEATPPRRILELAKDLHGRGANVAIRSICREDFDPLMEEVFWRIAPRPIDRCAGTIVVYGEPTATDEGECELVELLAPETGARCTAIPGRTDDGVDPETERRRCVVERTTTGGADEPSADGWYWTTRLDCFESYFVSYTEGAEPLRDSIVRLSCATTPAPEDDWVGWGTECDDEPSRCDAVPWLVSGAFPLGLVCDRRSSGTCRPRCASDRHCLDDFECGPDGFCRERFSCE